MALTDRNSDGSAFEPARLAKAHPESAFPAQALSRLAELHDEAQKTLELSQLLDRSPQGSLALMLLGGTLLLEATLQGGAALAPAFVWSLWILTGIAAMTVIYIRNFARHPAHQPLETAVRDLRKFLLFTGIAWGLGAFLVMPDRPSLGLILAFGVLPGWVVGLTLRNGPWIFSAPAALLTATACLLRPWPHGALTAAVIGLGWIAPSLLSYGAGRKRIWA